LKLRIHVGLLAGPGFAFDGEELAGFQPEFVRLCVQLSVILAAREEEDEQLFIADQVVRDQRDRVFGGLDGPALGRV